jgi:hypothetical protein
MNNRALLSIAALSLTVAACAALEGPPPPGPGTPGSSAGNPCTDPICEVSITATMCKEHDYVVNAVPDTLYVAPPNQMIHWTIKSGGYGFIGKGIDFKSEGGKTTFKNPKPGSTDWYYDNDGTKGKFDYGIWLKGPDGTCHVDPSIMN